MSCGHGGYGCGHWYGPAYGPPNDPPPYRRGFYGPPDRYDEPDWPVRPRNRRSRRVDRELAAGELEARLDDLREEVRRVEEDLARLTRSGEATGEGT